MWRWDQQEPFGADTPNGDPGNTGTTFDLPLRLPGQYFDKETNQHYNDQRDCYDPATGRYCQSDPIGLSGGLNTFTYVFSDPLGSIDPEGLFKQPGTFRSITGTTTPEIPARQIVPNGPGLVGIAILGGAIVTSIISSPAENFSVAAPTGNKTYCPGDSEHCKESYDRLMARYDALVKARARGFKVTEPIAVYRRHAFAHNALCFPRYQVPTYFN